MFRENLSFTIPLEPVALGRPRMTKSGIAYTPAKSKNAKSHIAYCVQQEWQDKPLDRPLSIAVKLFFSIPKNLDTKKNAAVLDADLMPHTKKPDADNCLKTVCDALNGVLWRDDSVISAVHIEKRYSRRPRTELTVKFEEEF